jgi:adenosylhomocysteine nucleosidase
MTEAPGRSCRIAILAAAVLAAACRSPAPAPARHDAGRAGGQRMVVLISASAEWKWVRSHFTGAAMRRSPYGEWFETDLAGASGPPVIFFHGGYGKVSAAGSTQYVIDRFRPSLLVNLGTCGGFEGSAKVGDIILVRETVIYDIIERMGDPAETLAHYSATLDTSRWPARLRSRVRIEKMLSADADIDPARVAELRSRGGVAGDWESGPIAWIAHRNNMPILILRGVSDVVSKKGDVTYGNVAAFESASRDIMEALIALLAEAAPELVD